MKIKKLVIPGLILIALIIVAANSLFVLNEDESAIVQRFGRIEALYVRTDTPDTDIPDVESQLAETGYGYVTVNRGAGLKFKVPFIDTLTKYTNRYMTYDTTPRQVITLDKKKLTFDNNAQWRIVNPVMFFISVHNVGTARDRLDAILYSRMNEKVGKMQSHTLITDKSTVENMLHDLAVEMSAEAYSSFGVEVVDIRIKRTDLPPENYESIYNRMITERSRIAAQYRSEGDEEAIVIRSKTDREVIELTSEAQKTAEVLKGEGDGEAAKIFNDAYGSDPDFFEFYNLLDTYRKTMGDTATLVIPYDSPIAKYLVGSTVAAAEPPIND